jgi:DNA-directed RNA polymerase subunit beta
VPPGVQGIVIDAKVFSRRGVEKDDRTRWIEDSEIASLEKERDDKLDVLQDVVRTKLEGLLVGQKCISSLKKGKKVLIQKGDKIDSDMLVNIPVAQFEGIVLKDPQLTEKIHDILEQYRDQCEICRGAFERQVGRFEKGDDLPPGVIKLVKVYVAMKRKLSVGDKMAGRHGNKGVVSRILPQEDLPYFEDGTPVDMILNPLGVPSRMNVGQVLEIHLGWAAKGLGDQLNRLLEEQKIGALRDKIKKIFDDPSLTEMIDGFDDKDVCEFVEDYKDGVHMATPVFDGAKEAEIKSLLTESGLNPTGQTTLYDGRTGEPFKEKITVGTMYVLKLHHLVDDKIHARSIGPYSLVTQQPLGGKAQFGGQRLGEMEVWAMEAYGAAHALQEFLTVKSDDMAGRTRMYEKIVKGQNTLDPGLPESFKVLTKELKSLGLDITLLEGKQ